MKNLAVKIQLESWNLSHRIKQGIKKLMTEENGDTNFISIIIVLIIVVGIAAILIKFKDDLKMKFDEVVGGFLDTLG